MSTPVAAPAFGSVTDLVQLGLCALTTGVIAYTLTHSHLTRPIRKRLMPIPFLGELASCGYCLSHWIAPIFALYISSSFFDFVLNTGAIIAGGALWMGVTDKYWHFQEAENAELRDLIQEAAQELKKAA